MSNHFLLVSRLKNECSYHHLSYMPSWLVQGQLYLYILPRPSVDSFCFQFLLFPRDRVKISMDDLARSLCKLKKTKQV
jgi:hypothetical protein